jgi:tetratricopeptide (TPR) repeat protein
LLASTAAQNTDAWLHLATGRAVAQSVWRFGPDPFAHTGGDTPEPLIAHSWFADLTAYALFQAFGGSMLVVLKAMIFAGLALMLFRVASASGGSTLPAACVGLAVLVASVRLPLQPVVLSYLFLGLTLLLLEHPRRMRGSGVHPGWLRAYWPLLALFALWANTDDWFLLGPALVLLYFLGEAIAPARSRGHDLLGLGLLVPAAVFACLLTPWHIHGLTLPPELGLTGAPAILSGDVLLGRVLVAPYERAYLLSSIASGAWVLLLVLGLVSFLLNREACRSWRLTVWLGFLAFACVNARAVPFFAIVAGPVMALNFVEFACRRQETAGRNSSPIQWAQLGRAFALPFGLFLLIAAWPGWLQGMPFSCRGWSLHPDPSVEKAARRLADLHEQGVLTADSRGFNFSAEAANALAWFCPQEQAFLTGHGPAGAAKAFRQIRHALLHRDLNLPYQQVFRANKIDHMILYDADIRILGDVFEYCMEEPSEWPLLALDGRVAIFGWRDPERPVRGSDAFKAATLQLARLGMVPPADKGVPADSAVPAMRPRVWWDGFWQPEPTPSMAADEAELYLRLFRMRGRAEGVRHREVWRITQRLSAIGFGAMPVLPTRLWAGLDGLGMYEEAYLAQLDDAPPGYLYAALRAARRGIAAEPNDAQAYLRLGLAYHALMERTRERIDNNAAIQLRRLRTYQAVAALHRAIELEPDLFEAHEHLASLYHDMNHLDRALEHFRQCRRLFARRGLRPGENQQGLAVLYEMVGKTIEHLEVEVPRQMNHFVVHSQYMKPFDRARVAVDRGLGAKALEVLLEQKDPAGAMGTKGVEMEFDQLLLAGRGSDLLGWFHEDVEKLLGSRRYHMWRGIVAATTGRYEDADAELVQSFPTEPVANDVEKLFSPREAIALVVGRSVLEGSQRLGDFAWLLGEHQRQASTIQIMSLLRVLAREADIQVWRALLAEEQGDTEKVKTIVWELLAGSGAGGVAPGQLDFGGRLVIQHLVELTDPKN